MDDTRLGWGSATEETRLSVIDVAGPRRGRGIADVTLLDRAAVGLAHRGTSAQYRRHIGSRFSDPACARFARGVSKLAVRARAGLRKARMLSLDKRFPVARVARRRREHDPGAYCGRPIRST
jgi:hypothetical protein